MELAVLGPHPSSLPRSTAASSRPDGRSAFSLASFVPDDFSCDEVIRGRRPVEIVCGTERVLAFRHTRPGAVHVVLIPKRHIPSILEVTPEDGAAVDEVLAVVWRVAADLTKSEGGCHVVTNTGSYQESKHLRVHVGAGEVRG